MNSKAEYQLSNALALDKKYKKLFIEKGAFNDEVEKYRNILRNSFEQIFLIDLNYAVSNDIESSLWRNIFYLVIDDYRKRNKEYKKAYSSLNPNDKFEFKVYSCSFHSFIKESISFYTDFIQKLTKIYNLSQVSKVFKPLELSFINLSIEPLDPSQINEKTKEVAVKVCHQTLIYLGDLIRYSEMYSEITYKNWNIAENYYQMAIQLIPCNGNPFNQLAVIASYELKSLIAIENYMRSLAISVPFTTSSDNLYLAIEKVKSKKDILKEKYKNREYPKSFSKAYITNMKSDFLNDYERLISYCYGCTKDVDKFLEMKPYILDVFSILLETKYLDTDELITLSIINMTLHYLLVNKHLTKLCKIKKENIPNEFDEPSPMDEILKKELIKFNLEFFDVILTVSLRKENTTSVKGQTFSYANAVSQDDSKKKQTNSQDKKENYLNLNDLLINIIIYTQWCKVKLSEKCPQLTESIDWIIKLKDILTIINDINPIKTDNLIDNKKVDLFISKNGYYLFKNAVYLRGFLPLQDETNEKHVILNSYYYKNFEDISSPEDILNDQIEYLLKLSYELSELSEGNLFFSLKEIPLNHKLKLIITNTKEAALKIDGKINIITGRGSSESLTELNLNNENNDDEDNDDDNLDETIVFTGRNREKSKQKEEDKIENKVPDSLESGSASLISSYNNSYSSNNFNINESNSNNNNNNNNNKNKNDINNINNDNITNDIDEDLNSINNMININQMDSNNSINTQGNKKEPSLMLSDLKDDLDVSMDLKSILKESEKLPSHDQTHDYTTPNPLRMDGFYSDNLTNKTPHLNTTVATNTLNINDDMPNKTPTSAFFSATTPSGLFSPFDWNKEYAYPFSNSIIPVQNPNKSNSNDILSTPKRDPINNNSIKDNKKNSTPIDFNYKWLQSQNMFAANTNYLSSIQKNNDDNALFQNNSNSDHPSIPPGLNVQTKNKIPQIFTNSSTSSGNSDNFVSADIFSKMDNQQSISPPNPINTGSNNDINKSNDSSNVTDTINSPNNNSKNNNENSSVDVISLVGFNNILKIPPSNQQPLQPLQPSSHLNTPVGPDAPSSANALLNNPLFMGNKPPSNSSAFPPFSNSQLTPQKQNQSSQQPTPSNLQSPLFFPNTNSNVTSPAAQMFMSNQAPSSNLQNILPLKNLHASPESSTTNINSGASNSIQNSFLSLPYSNQMLLPGFNPAILQQPPQSQQPQPPQSHQPLKQAQQVQQPQQPAPPQQLPFPQQLPSGGNIPVNTNLPMNLTRGLGPTLGMNNNFFGGNNPMNNFQNVNMDPRLYGIPPNTNLNSLNGLINNQAIPTLNPNPMNPNQAPTNLMSPLNMPVPINTSHLPNNNIDNNAHTPVNPLLNLINSPLAFNSVGAGMFYPPDNTNNNNNNSTTSSDQANK